MVVQSKPKISPVSHAVTTAFFNSAVGELSLERASQILNQPKFMDEIFGLVVETVDKVQAILRKKYDLPIAFAFVNHRLVVKVGDNQSLKTYPIFAILNKPESSGVSGLRIEGNSLRIIQGREIVEFTAGLKELSLSSVVVFTPKDTFAQASTLPMRKWDDEELLKAMIVGDTEAFGTYIERHRKYYLRHGTNFGLNEEDRHEALQKVQLTYVEFVKAGVWPSKFNGTTDGMKGWIHTCFTREKLSIVRHHSRQTKNGFIEDVGGYDDEGGSVSFADFTAQKGSEGLREPSQNLECYQTTVFLNGLRNSAEQTGYKHLKFYLTLLERQMDNPEFNQIDLAKEFGISGGTGKTHVARAKEWIKKQGYKQRARDLCLI